MKRFFGMKAIAFLLAFIMAFTVMPSAVRELVAYVSAEGEGPRAVLDKTAVLQDDGTYTITLEAYTTGVIETLVEYQHVPSDIVLVFDVSGSMDDHQTSYGMNMWQYHLTALKTAAKEFVNYLYQNSNNGEIDHRVALVTYSNDSDGSYKGTGAYVMGSGASDTFKLYNSLTSNDYKKTMHKITNTTERNKLVRAIDSLETYEATAMHRGMQMANNILEEYKDDKDINGNDRTKIVILFTDGCPGRIGYNTSWANSAITAANTARNTYGATVMSISLINWKFITAWNNYMQRYYSSYYSYYGEKQFVNADIQNLMNAITDNTNNPGNFFEIQNAVDNGVNAQDRLDNINNLTAGFLQIANKVIEISTNSQNTVPLGQDAYMRDYLSQYFKLRDVDLGSLSDEEIAAIESGFITDNIKIYSVPCIGLNEDGTASFDASQSVDITGTLGVEVSLRAKSVSVTGWDYSAHACIDDAGNISGDKLIVVIQGVLAEDDAVGDELPTNVKEISGIYPDGTATKIPAFDFDGDGDDTDLQFPLPHVRISDSVVVYDFGLQMRGYEWYDFFNGLDWALELHTFEHQGETYEYWEPAKMIDSVLCLDGYYREQNDGDLGLLNYNKYFPYAGCKNYEFFADHGRIEISTDDEGKEVLNFIPVSISHDDFVFTALVKFDPEKNDGVEYEWARVSIVQATNVLYDDSIIYRPSAYDDIPALFDGNTSDNSVFDYSEGWTIEQTGETFFFPQQGFGNDTYGFDLYYTSPFYSSGASRDGQSHIHKTEVTDEMYRAVKNGTAQWPTIEFAFRGTGIDIISRTGSDTGLMAVDIVPADKPWNYAGSGASGVLDSVHIIVDTYYRDGSGNPLYQIPVFHIDGLRYGMEWLENPEFDANDPDPSIPATIAAFFGDYKVRVTAVYLPSCDHQSANSVEYRSGAEVTVPGTDGISYEYNRLNPLSKSEPTKGAGTFNVMFDGVRVYNPHGTEVGGKGRIELAYSSAESAFGGTSELNPDYKQIRQLFIENNGENTSVLNIFIDGQGDKPVYLEDYIMNGPKNEMYVGENGAVAFNLEGDYAALHISFKAPQYPVIPLINGEPIHDVFGDPVVVDHAAELYYDITDCVKNIAGEKVVTISCARADNEDPDNPFDNTKDNAILSIVGVKLVPVSDNTAPNIVAGPNLFDAASAVIAGVEGDANHDFTLNISDVIAALRSVIGVAELDAYGSYCADMNKNGVVDTDDVMALLRSIIIG